MGGDVVAEMCGVVLKTDSHVLEVFCNKPVYRKSLSQIFRFGFHNASAIESLIDKEASLATILDQDDLLQECKAQNTRLAEYFGRVGVLHRLFAYVTGEIEIEGKDRFKYVLAPLFPRALSLTLHPNRYPYVATEVLCSDIWSISATCVGKSDVVLAPFWDFVLDRSPDDMKTRTVMASHFVKINLSFIIKWPEKVSMGVWSCRLSAEFLSFWADARVYTVPAEHCGTTPKTYRVPLFRRSHCADYIAG